MTPLFCVDAFTDAPFSGNPAAVCLLTEPAKPAWMQQLASELGLSETAFLLPTSSGYDLRWFTPKAEVDLCGHATLASAHVIWETGIADQEEELRFNTLSGVLGASRQKTWITLDFPAEPPQPVSEPEGLGTALGISVVECYANRLDSVVVLADEHTVRHLKPDFEALARVEARGVIITSESESRDVDFVSRFFAPTVGIPEDPVTGSAHCALGPFWAERLKKDTLTGYQASSRGGVVKVRVQGDRVALAGQATTIWKGALAPSAAPR
jgi:PhzF family phenazine biosynthesis protein